MIEDLWPMPSRDTGAPSTIRYLNRLQEPEDRPRRRHSRRVRSETLAPVLDIDKTGIDTSDIHTNNVGKSDVDGPDAQAANPVPGVAPGRLVAETMRSAVAASSVDLALDRVVDAAMQTGRWIACGVSVIEADGGLRSVGRASSSAGRLDELQFLIGEGPVLDVVSAEPVLQVLSADLEEENRWPGWSTVAAGTGIRSVLTLRLFTDVTVGALSLYSRHRACSDAATIAAAQVAAAQASVVLAFAQCEWRLGSAVDVQNTIGRAQGILMQRYAIAAEAATVVLRTYSVQHGLTVHEVARRIADSGASFDPSSWILFRSRRTPMKGGGQR